MRFLSKFRQATYPNSWFTGLGNRNLPILGQVESKSRQDTELALDLYPAGAAQEGPRVIPLLNDALAGTQTLQPKVKHLLTVRLKSARYNDNNNV